MRPSLSLLIITAWAVAPAWAQTAAPQPAGTKPATTVPKVAHPSRHSPARHSPPPHAADRTRSSATAGRTAGVVDLGATDITGNKELPKVMVIVPWKDSLGAGGVVKPTDSLLDEVLTPVDRDVFRREVTYYEAVSNGSQGAAPPAAVTIAV